MTDLLALGTAYEVLGPLGEGEAGADADLRYCPRCGRESVDRKRHGWPGRGVCTLCGTMFTVLATTA